MNRSHFDPRETVANIWRSLNMPRNAIDSLQLTGFEQCLSSSFKVDHIAQSSIALSALAAAQFWAIRNSSSIPTVRVPIEHACVEFKSERLYVLNGVPVDKWKNGIGGLHKTQDGYVRMHDSFPNHRQHALELLGLQNDATREQVAAQMLKWRAVGLEQEAFRRGAVILALRSFKDWDNLSQAQAVADLPILLEKLSDSEPFVSWNKPAQMDKCLRGIRVVEMSRVIAAPVAGKTLAAHGADVIWVTSPNLANLPDLDRDLARGKRTVQLDIQEPNDREKLLELLRTADVFIQGYRPGSLAARGLSPEELTRTNPNLVIANLSAWGPNGPWAQYRGFDSLVQTCSGINVADAEAFGENEVARVLPCQVFDHGAGYLLASGISIALCKRATEGGSYQVHVSLAGVMKYMRSLGHRHGRSGFDRKDFKDAMDVERYLETRESGFGELRAVRHAAAIEGIQVGWDIMPKPLGTDQSGWLE